MRPSCKDFKEIVQMGAKENNMKNRMPVYFASMAMFVAATAVVPGSAGAVGYKSSTSSAVSGPQIYQPIGCARSVVNTYFDTATFGSGTVTAMGSATLTLSGANTYFGGATVVDSGVITINGGSSLTGAGAIQMGTGTIQMNPLIAGSILSAGNILGTITFNGDLVLSSGTTNILELFSGDLYNVFSGSGASTLTMSGSTVFDFTGWSGGMITNGMSVSLFQNWGAINTNGLTYSELGLVDFSGSSLTVIPEPASAMMLLFGAGVGLAVHRARRGAMRR